jgi:hypothetical protein
MLLQHTLVSYALRDFCKLALPCSFGGHEDCERGGGAHVPACDDARNKILREKGSALSDPQHLVQKLKAIRSLPAGKFSSGVRLTVLVKNQHFAPDPPQALDVTHVRRESSIIRQGKENRSSRGKGHIIVATCAHRRHGPAPALCLLAARHLLPRTV